MRLIFWSKHKLFPGLILKDKIIFKINRKSFRKNTEYFNLESENLTPMPEGSKLKQNPYFFWVKSGVLLAGVVGTGFVLYKTLKS